MGGNRQRESRQSRIYVSARGRLERFLLCKLISLSLLAAGLLLLLWPALYGNLEKRGILWLLPSFFFVFRRTVCVSITTQSTAGSLYNAHQTANSTVCLHARLHFEHGRIYTEEGRKKQKMFLWGVMLLIRKKKRVELISKIWNENLKMPWLTHTHTKACS